MRRLSLALAVALVVVLGGAATAFAQPAFRVVDDDGLARPGNCDANRQAFTSIQAAVDASAPGDVVIVCPGAFPENVTVNKTLDLLGAQEGVDARSRVGAEESIVQSGTVTLQADGVVFDGFTVTGTDGSGDFGPGILTSASFSGYRVLNNIVSDNVFGLYVNSNGMSQTVVTHNAFVANNRPGAASGNGIYSDVGLDSALIDENSFSAHVSSAMVLLTSIQGVTISENDSSEDATLLALFDGDAVTVTANAFDGTDAGSGIFLGGGNGDVDVSGNSVVDATTAVSVADVGFGPNAGPITVTGNSLTGNLRGVRLADDTLTGSLDVHDNTIAGNAVFGVENLDDDGDELIDATQNWWGSADGPSDWSIGSGDAVSAEVDFFPWYVDAAMTTLEACDFVATPGVRTSGTATSDIICGSSGNDELAGRGGDDLILGFDGDDIAVGGQGDDALIGHPGDDILRGVEGFDSLQGRAGADACHSGLDGAQTSTCESGA